MRRNIPGVLWLALAAALGMRAFQAWTRPVVLAAQAPAEFELLARSAASGGGLSYDGKTPTAFRLPGYPLALAGVSLLTGRPDSPLPATLLNILASLCMVFVVFRLALRLLPAPWAAAAALLAGINPELAELDFRATAEGIFALEFALAALCAVRVLEEPGRWTRWAACGAVLGLSLVTRSTLLVWPPVLAAGLMLARPGPGVLRRAGVLVLCAYAFTAAWTARNLALFGRVVPFEDGMGWHMLWQGSTSVEGVQPDENLPEPLKTYFFAKDPRIGPASKTLAVANIAADPLRYAGLCLRRLPVLWFRGAWAERALGFDEAVSAYAARGAWGGVAAKAAGKALELGVLLCALWGGWSLRRDPRALVVAGQVLYMNIHVFTMGLPRYVAPAFPLTALLAVCGAAALRCQLGGKPLFSEAMGSPS